MSTLLLAMSPIGLRHEVLEVFDTSTLISRQSFNQRIFEHQVPSDGRNLKLQTRSSKCGRVKCRAPSPARRHASETLEVLDPLAFSARELGEPDKPSEILLFPNPCLRSARAQGDEDESEDGAMMTAR